MKAIYVVMMLQPWDSIRPVGTKHTITMTGDSCGFMAVYDDRETAEGEWPGITVVEMAAGEKISTE